MGFPSVSVGKESACNAGDPDRLGFNSWIGKIPWRRACKQFQYSCLENPMKRGAWWATVHRVTKSWTQLKQQSTHAHNLWHKWDLPGSLHTVFLCTPWLITTVSIYFHSWWWKYCSAMVTWLETDKATLYQISVAALTPNCRQSPKLNVQVKGRGSYEIAEGGQGCWLPNLWALIRIRETGPKSKVKAHKVM